MRHKLETADIHLRTACPLAVIQEIRFDYHRIQIMDDKASLAAPSQDSRRPPEKLVVLFANCAPFGIRTWGRGRPH